MDLLSTLWHEAWEDGSVLLVGGLFLLAFLLRTFAPDERTRLRAILVLTILHLILMPICAGLRRAGADAYPDVRLPTLIIGTLAAAGMLSTLVFAIGLPRVGLRAPRIVRDVITAVATIIAVITIANRAGFPVSGLITTSAVLTAVIGFSTQDTIGNIAGGLALQLDNSIQVGDWVKVGDLRGRVVDLRWRYTAIETRNWETVLVANSVIMKGQVIVEGRRTGQPVQLRRWVWFNVDFRYQPSDVIQAVNEALQSGPIERVSATPAPHCILMALEQDSYAKYAVRYWLTDIAVDDPTDSVIRTRIYFALKRANIPLSIPAHTVFMTEENQEKKAERLVADMGRRMKALAQVELFDHLDKATHERLAQRLRYAPFTTGEVMTKQDAIGHWLYMIIEGDAAIRIAKEGVDIEVARIHSGSFFGEMSLMTGSRRTATVVALSDVECYRLDKAAFQDIIKERPEMAEKLAEILAARRVSLLAARDNLDAEAKKRALVDEKADLVDKIRDFFGLRTGRTTGAVNVAKPS
jgi:small-conductance mechanosensitive channel/CRP-like cAMP-binding protein